MKFRSLLAALLITAVLFPAAAVADNASCSDDVDGVHSLTLTVNGEEANGLYALPAGEPTALVVYNHGWGHTPYSWVHAMRQAADRGAIAVTMDYRGLIHLGDTDNDGFPESSGFNIWKGAEDSIEAGRFFAAMCPSTSRMRVLFSTSLGSNIGGVVLTMGPKAIDGSPLFDYWVNNEGETNLIETYLEARTVAVSGNDDAVDAVKDIEAETGGPIESRFEEYRKRTVVLHGPQIKAAGIKAAVVVHGLDDGFVPYNQGREMAAVLRQQEIPVDFYTIARRSPESGTDTPLTGYVVGPLQPGYTTPLVGHASEKHPHHITNRVAFNALWELLRGESPPCYRDFVVDQAENRTLLKARTDLPCI